MGTLYIDRKNIHVKLDGNALAFYVDGEREGTAPISPLSRVIVVGRATIETNVLHKLAEQKVSVLFLSGRSLNFGGILHGKFHNNGMLRVRQYEKSLTDFSLQMGIELVTLKIKGQIEILKNVMGHRDELKMAITPAIDTLKSVMGKLKDVKEHGSLLGLEGGASATYFNCFIKFFAPSLEFTKRTRRPPKDPVNSMLSLCYTLLHFEMVREIEIIGLDPCIGFYHKFEYGRESLACDLVEAYRHQVDEFVYNLFRTREFDKDDFYIDQDSLGCYINKTSRKDFYHKYEQWATAKRSEWKAIVRYIVGRINDGKDIVS